MRLYNVAELSVYVLRERLTQTKVPNPRDERRLENDGCVIWDTALAPVAPWFCGYVVLLDLWAMLDQLGRWPQASRTKQGGRFASLTASSQT